MQPVEIIASSYARFTYAAGDYALCDSDREPYYGSVRHQPLLDDSLNLGAKFLSGGVIEGGNVSLDVVDPAGGTFRTLFAGNDMEGTEVAIDVVCVVTFDDGSSSTISHSQTLTMGDVELRADRIRVQLVDLEDAKLGALYPPQTWASETWLQIWAEDAGQPICYPVGTALKLPCALLRADETNAEYWYGVCEAPTVEVAISAVSTGAKTFTIAGDYTDRISAGAVIFVDGSSANNGKYTVVSAVYTSSTVITVSETISSATADGNVLLIPVVLAVYRDGRLVPSTEYVVELLDEGTAQYEEPDFDAAGSEWITSTLGTGTATISGGNAVLSGDGGASNYGIVYALTAIAPPVRHSYTPVRLVNDAALTISGFTAPSRIISSGNNWVPVRNVLTTSQRVLLATANSGYSGTVNIDSCYAQTGTGRQIALRFSGEQVGFSGEAYRISADVRGVNSRNVVDEIQRLLEAAGVTVDSTSFASAQSYADSNVMLVDCDYGRSGRRRIRAILEDLLYIARATLYRTSSGSYAIAQDRTATLAATLDETSDKLAVQSITKRARPTSVALSYRPSARDPNELQHIITRPVTGGTTGEANPRAVRYLRDHEAADRLLCYLALREQYNRTLRGRQYGAQRELAERINITATAHGSSAQDWQLRAVTRIPGGVDFEAVEYAAAVHTYTASDPLPGDAGDNYTPDYSQTPPAAPSALTISAGSTAVGTGGDTRAYIEVSATVPTVNWSQIWFYAEHNSTGEIPALIRGEVSGSTATATLTGLRPGEVYALKCYAINAFDQLGVVQDTFNATAIGGGSSVTTFTAPGYATLPANVTGINAAQGSALLIDVRWLGVTSNVLAEYVLERSEGAGYTEVWRGRATTYVDRAVSYGTGYTYRVKARDTYGNLSSAWNTSGSVTPIANIYGGGSGDIPSNTVDTTNRTAASSASTGVSIFNTNSNTGSVSHSLGKIPLATVSTNFSGMLVAAVGLSSTDVDVIVGRIADNSGSSSPSDPHSHILYAVGLPYSPTVTVYFW